ncbi:hypothetical protein P8452_43865 [Trifolium repens]|nr:hypothetical protein P8452_43865 [Trifolium repens]
MQGLHLLQVHSFISSLFSALSSSHSQRKVHKPSNEHTTATKIRGKEWAVAEVLKNAATLKLSEDGTTLQFYAATMRNALDI